MEYRGVKDVMDVECAAELCVDGKGDESKESISLCVRIGVERTDLGSQTRRN